MKSSIETECSNLSESKPNNSIFREWCLLIRILRSVGSSPLTLGSKIGESSGKVPIFRFQALSLTTFYAVVWHSIRIGLCYLYYKNWGQYMLGRKYNNTMEDWIVKSMNVSLPFYQFWDLCCVWLTFSKTAEFCNTWLNFESKFNETFGSHYDYQCTLKAWRRILILSTIIPIGAVSSVFIMDLVAAIQSPTGEFAGFSTNNALDWFSAALVILPTPFFVLTTILEEVKVLLMYRTMTESYVNIRKGIQSQVKEGNLLTEDVICQWTKLLGIIRRQAKLTGELQAPQQLVVFTHTIIIFTECFFLFIKTTMSAQMNKYIWVSTGISCMFAVRLLAKIIIADKITVEEQLIGEEIMEIAPSHMDILGKLEAKKVTDLILQKPVVITFAGYVFLRKPLIPKILSYVVAYLVVLFQFQLSNGFRNIQTDNCTTSI